MSNNELKRKMTEEKKRKIYIIIWTFSISVFIIGASIIMILHTIANDTGDSIAEKEKIETYEVVSVYKYARHKTNNWGATIGTDICYNFSYISEGKLYHVDDFIHQDRGFTRVTIGDSDCYIVNKTTGQKYLQLTKETLKLLSGVSE